MPITEPQREILTRELLQMADKFPSELIARATGRMVECVVELNAAIDKANASETSSGSMYRVDEAGVKVRIDLANMPEGSR